MSDQDINALPKEQLAKLPALVLLERATGSRASAVLTIELALRDLFFYFREPSSEMNPDLTEAIRGFQSAIGAQPTGDLVWEQAEELMRRSEALEVRRVLPNPGVSVQSIPTPNHELVFASGTWVFADGTKQATPIQTTEIRCRKPQDMCVQTTAKVHYEYNGPPSLTLEEDYFDITKWSDAEVVAENAASLCVSYTLTISVTEKSAHMMRRRRSAEGDCSYVTAEPQILKLVDGFQVGWDFDRQKNEEAAALRNPRVMARLRTMMTAEKSAIRVDDAKR